MRFDGFSRPQRLAAEVAREEAELRALHEKEEAEHAAWERNRFALDRKVSMLNKEAASGEASLEDLRQQLEACQRKLAMIQRVS